MTIFAPPCMNVGYDRIAYSLFNNQPSLGLLSQHGLATSYPETGSNITRSTTSRSIDQVTRQVLTGNSQEFLELVRDRLPVLRGRGAEGAGHCTPSRVSDHDGFFRFGRIAILGFNLFEGADGGDIVEGFFPEAAFADAVACCYPEVAGGGFFLLGLESADDRCGRSSLDGNAHSAIAVSHAAW